MYTEGNSRTANNRALSPALRALALKDLPAARRWSGRATRRQTARAPGEAREPIVVVPVHNAPMATARCLDSLIACGISGDRILVIDDASDDRSVRNYLARLARSKHIRLERNPSNLGFAATVNRAFAACPQNDIVLLNSDTLVAEDWLERLTRAAYSAADICSVTPLSNEGGLSSYPLMAGGPIKPSETPHWHALVRRTLDRQTAELPVGNGFCLYLRRDSLEAIGEFDAAIFGAGYGEETDFCLQARALGWRHVAALDVYVYHQGGASFGEHRSALLERSQHLLHARHPGFRRLLEHWAQSNPLTNARRALDEARLQQQASPWALLVSHAGGGGVERHVSERTTRLRAQGLATLLLTPAVPGEHSHVHLLSTSPTVLNLRYAIPADLARLSSLLTTLRIDHVEIHHFLGLSPRLIDAVTALGVPVDVTLHDYAWYCPQVTLVDASGRYCGEPAVSTCRTCCREQGSALGERTGVVALRKRSERWLRLARQVRAPSADCAKRYHARFPDLPIAVEGLSDARPRALAATGASARPTRKNGHTAQRAVVRVALLGALARHKGHDLLLACARDAARRRLALEFVVIGYTADDARLERTGRVSITGPYEDPDVQGLIEREAPDLFFMASVWPETWCYALDPLIESAQPIVAFDIGAIAERLRDNPAATLMPIATEARAVNDVLLRVAAQAPPDPPRYPSSSTPSTTTEAHMTKRSDTNPGARKASLTAAIETLEVSAGLYLFSVMAGPARPDQPSGSPALPAALVTLAPGLDPQAVQFIDGPRGHSSWLCFAGDQLVARVTGAGTTLVITSMRDGPGPSLSIKAERLESRLESGAAPAMGTRPAQVARAHAGGATGTPPAAGSMAITAHVRMRGDRQYPGDAWAGCEGKGLWIESFSIVPPAPLSATDVEYKALTASGFETPWTASPQNCGTQALGVALLGFAIRLRGEMAARYDVQYQGMFQTGGETALYRNGIPCRSSTAGDVLEGLRVAFVPRPAAFATPEKAAAKTAARSAKPALKGAPATKAATKATTKAPTKAPKKAGRKTPAAGSTRTRTSSAR